MPESGTIVRYLDSMYRSLGERSRADLERSFNPFITISREAGAGGRSLAEALLSAFDSERGAADRAIPRGSAASEDLGAAFRGWQGFDQELCRLVAEDARLKVSMRALLNEECHGEIADLIAQFVAGVSPQNTVVARVFETVRKLAILGKAVIVGRGGAFFTRDLPWGIHVRLVAPREIRVRHVMRRLGLGEDAAERYVRDQDAGRGRLVRIYFRQDIADARHYDAVFNTERVPVERVAGILVRMVGELHQRHLDSLRSMEAAPGA